MRRLYAYLGLAVLVIGAVLGIGLGLSEAPTTHPSSATSYPAVGSIITRLVLDHSRVRAGVTIKGYLVVQNAGPTINLTELATSRFGRSGHEHVRRPGCKPGVAVALGNRRYHQAIFFAAQCSAQPLLIREGLNRLPVSILTTFTDCLQPGGSQVASPTTVPTCPPGSLPPVLPAGRYRTTVVWSEQVPIPKPQSVVVTITR